MAKALQDAIVLFGDSMMEQQEVLGNLHHRMSAAYSRKLDVVNRGFSGYNTDGKTDTYRGQRVRMVIIWLGTNDAYLPNGPVHLPLDRFLINMRTILSFLTSPASPYSIAETPVSIVLITPHPIIPSMRPYARDPGYVPDQDNESQRKYRQAVLQVASEWKVMEGQQEMVDGKGWKLEVLDLWDVMVRDAGGEDEALLQKYYTDGTHFNSTGYAVLWDALAALIKDKFKGRGLDYEDLADLPFRTPLWNEVDCKSRPEDVIDKMR